MELRTTHRAHGDVEVSSFKGRANNKSNRMRYYLELNADYIWLTPGQTRKLIAELKAHLKRMEGAH